MAFIQPPGSKTVIGKTIADVQACLNRNGEHQLHIVFTDGSELAVVPAEGRRLVAVHGEPDNGPATALRLPHS